MSITFSAPNTPDIIGQFDCTCGGDPNCGECEDQVIKFYEPEGSFNAHNGGAMALITLLNLPDDGYGCGELPREDFPKLRRAIMMARNLETRRAPLRVEGYHQPGGWAGTRIVEDGNVHRIQRMGPEIISGGIDDEYLLRHLDNFDRLLSLAEMYDSPYISWG